MKYYLGLITLLLPLTVSASLYVTIIEGLAGAANYGQQFSEQVSNLSRSSKSVTDKENVYVFSGENASKESLESHFGKLKTIVKSEGRIVIFLIGHGSFDDKQYKFNIPGPDLTGEDLLAILEGFSANSQLLVNTSSSSGALLKLLENDSRIVITATRNGSERNAPRFGSHFVDALDNVSADINKNNSISAQEAFDYASRQIKDFYEYEDRLATEHPRLQGELAAQFNLARIKIDDANSKDPEQLRLVKLRDEINGRIDGLRFRKADMSNEEYLNQLQEMLLELALLEGQIEQFDETGKQQ